MKSLVDADLHIHLYQEKYDTLEDSIRQKECNQHFLSACYERGVGCWDLQIHPVWAKAFEANDLRWIQIHGDLHRVLRNTEKNT